MTKKASGNNPVWNEEFEFPMEFWQGQNIAIDVFDADKFSEDEHLGNVSIDVEQIKESQLQNVWYDLGNCGKLRIRSSWIAVKEDSKLEGEESKSMVLSLFVGKILNRKKEKLIVKVEIETEKEKVETKAVQQNDDGEIVFNEGFLLMLKKREKKFLIKLIDTEANLKIGQEFVNIRNSTDEKIHEYKISKVTTSFSFKWINFIFTRTCLKCML